MSSRFSCVKSVMMWLFAASLYVLPASAADLQVDFSGSANSDGLVLTSDSSVVPIVVETNNHRSVLRAVSDLAEDFNRASGHTPPVQHDIASPAKTCVIVGTLGQGGVIDKLVADKKIDVS